MKIYCIGCFVICYPGFYHILKCLKWPASRLFTVALKFYLIVSLLQTSWFLTSYFSGWVYSLSVCLSDSLSFPYFLWTHQLLNEIEQVRFCSSNSGLGGVFLSIDVFIVRWKSGHTIRLVSVTSNKKENIGLYTDSQSQQGKPNLGIALCPGTDNSKGSMEMILLCVMDSEKSRCITSKIQMGWSGTSVFGSQAFVQRTVSLWFCSTLSKLSGLYCSPAQSVLREEVDYQMSWYWWMTGV